MNARTTRPAERLRGATLIEVAISTVLVGLVMVAALDTAGSSVRLARQGTATAEGRQLAQLLMAEALALPYEDPDGNTAGIGIEADEPSNPTDRLAVDDLDDLDKWDSTPPIATDGTPMPLYAGWRRRVFITYLEADPGDPRLDASASDEGVKQIQLRVTSPDGETTTLWGYRSKHGVADATSPLERTLVTRFEAAIAVGSGAVSRAAVSPLNEPEAP